MHLADLRHAVGRRLRNYRRNRVEGVGHDFVGDIRSRLPHVEVMTIFDVGAHIGMTAIEFSDEFPCADVCAFEPHPRNLARLKSNLIGKPNIRIYPIGMSDKAGTASFEFDPEHPSMARIADEGPETIQLESIDGFCAANSVEQIDLLKIDVEGHEVEVLSGATRLLSEDRIAIIRVETAIDPDIAYHTQLWDLCELLHPLGYRLFGFYDQWEFPLVNNPKLRRFDAAFISPSAQRRPEIKRST
jgi:FkbM family methyltransferase